MDRGRSPEEGCALHRDEFPSADRYVVDAIAYVDCTPPSVFAWAAGDPEKTAATGCFTLNEAAHGTDLSYTVCVGPGRSGVSMLVDREPLRRDQIVTNRLAQFERRVSSTESSARPGSATS